MSNSQKLSAALGLIQPIEEAQTFDVRDVGSINTTGHVVTGLDPEPYQASVQFLVPNGEEQLAHRYPSRKSLPEIFLAVRDVGLDFRNVASMTQYLFENPERKGDVLLLEHTDIYVDDHVISVNLTALEVLNHLRENDLIGQQITVNQNTDLLNEDGSYSRVQSSWVNPALPARRL